MEVNQQDINTNVHIHLISGNIYSQSKSLLYNKLLKDDLIQICFLIMIGWPCILLQHKMYFLLYCHTMFIPIGSEKEELVRGISQLFWTSLVKMSCWIAIAHSNTTAFQHLGFGNLSISLWIINTTPNKALTEPLALTEKCLIAAVTRLLYPH